MTNEELHKYFYEKHQNFWEKVIEIANKKKYPKIIYIKTKAHIILYPNIKLICNCFGCHFTYTFTFTFQNVYIHRVDCNRCFLNLKCNDKNSLYYKLRYLFRSKKEFISLCEKIRDCGFHITRSKTKMMKLYKEMNK